MAKRKKRNSILNPTLSRGIIAIVLIISAIIIALSFFDMAGAVGVMLDKYILSFLFGKMRYAVPFVIVILAWFLIKDIRYKYRPTHLVGAFLFFLAASSIMHIGFETNEMWREALEGNGGGIFGMLAWPIKNYLGNVAGIVILAGFVAVGILFIFNTSLVHFVIINKKLFAGLGWLGKAFYKTIKSLFVKTNSQEPTDYEDEYEYDEEEPMKKRRFFSRRLNERNEEEEEEDEDEEDMEEEFERNESSTPIRQKVASVKVDEGPWSKKIIIKPIPSVKLLSDKRGKPTSGDIKANAEIIKDTLAQFNIDVSMGDVRVGPTVTQYSLKPSKGIKLTRITSLSNDLALSLAAHPIRIEAPIPGKSLVGIEVPNQKAAMVSFKEILESKTFKTRAHDMMIALGKDVAGRVWFADLPKMPHLLIAGATGSGKTVCINTILMSLLYQNTAETLRLIMVDPKRVELTLYNNIPHLLAPVITNTQKTVNALKWTISEMDRRFDLLAKAGCRDISSYNKKYKNDKLPHIVFIIDELADLMATAAGEVEAGIIRIAQMARAVGIHLIVATQRPSVDVITGLMKANIPARIAFSVASLTDSRTILDSPGAEKLMGRGDMLFQTAELSKPVRIQASFISEEEVKRIVRYLKADEKPEYDESIVTGDNESSTNMFGGNDDRDELFEQAKIACIKAGKGSTSYLQRKLKIGYNRAARIMDELEKAGVVGPQDGSKPREVLMTLDDIETSMGAGGEQNVFSDDEENDNYDDNLDNDYEDEEEDYEENNDNIEDDDYDDSEEKIGYGDEDEDLEDEDFDEEDEEEDEYRK
ncbi:MAG: hypothetical protein GF349_00805 [Candidatus Magasanikbacteria bacterium]|nr:hypothetical protein [Candidatus Magasanikbacteria bacterium]